MTRGRAGSTARPFDTKQGVGINFEVDFVMTISLEEENLLCDFLNKYSCIGFTWLGDPDSKVPLMTPDNILPLHNVPFRELEPIKKIIHGKTIFQLYEQVFKLDTIVSRYSFRLLYNSTIIVSVWLERKITFDPRPPSEEELWDICPIYTEYSQFIMDEFVRLYGSHSDVFTSV